MSPSKTLLRLELNRTLRSTRGRAVAVSSFLALVVASALGSALAAAHQRAAEVDVEAARARRARSGFVRSPLDAARWTDTVVARPIPALAALTAGDLDALPDAGVIRLHEAPRPVPPRAERSTSATVLGTFDVAWVLGLLLPLAVLVLAHDRFARDRSSGTLAMLLAFAPSPGALVLARTAAVALTVGLGVLPGLVLGLGMATTHVRGPPGALDVVAVLVLSAASVIAWSAALVAVSAHSARVGQALALGLGLWATFSVVVPLASASLGPVAFPEPDPRRRLAATQAALELTEQDGERLVHAELVRAPQLDPEQALDRAESNQRFDLLLSRAMRRRSKGALHERARTLEQRAELSRIAAYLAPSTIVSHGLASLAGTDPEAHQRFAAQLAAHQARLDAFVAAPLEAHDLSAFVPHQWPEPELRGAVDRGPAFVGAGLLLAVAALSMPLARARLLRGDLAPGPEDP